MVSNICRVNLVLFQLLKENCCEILKSFGRHNQVLVQHLFHLTLASTLAGQTVMVISCFLLVIVKWNKWPEQANIARDFRWKLVHIKHLVRMIITQHNSLRSGTGSRVTLTRLSHSAFFIGTVLFLAKVLKRWRLHHYLHALNFSTTQ